MSDSNKIRSSLYLSTIDSLIIKITSFLSVVIFSRLLTPSELGIFAIASSVTFMATEVRMLGTNAYLVKEQNLTQAVISTCVGVSMLISWGLGLLLFFSASFISDFYTESNMTGLLKLMSIAFFFSPFTSIATAYFSKEFNYRDILIIHSTSKVSALLLSITLVLNGFGVMSLAIALLGSSVIEFALSFYFKRNKFSFLPSLKGALAIFSFGITNSMINILNRLELSISDLILGKIGTAYQVAVFSRGLGLHVFIKGILAEGVSSVALPYFSQVKKNGESLASAYTKATQKFLTFALPPIAVSALIAKELILLLFGEQWIEAIVIAECLFAWMAIKLTMNFSQMCLITLGQQKLLLYVKILTSSILVCTMFFAYRLDFSFFFISFIIAAVFEHVVTYYILIKKMKLQYWKFLKAQIIPLGITVICAFQAIIIKSTLSSFEISNLSIIPYLSLIPTWAILVRALDNELFNEFSALFKKGN